MKTYKVIKIIDGDTFDVLPAWEFRGKKGHRVRPVGYNTPEWFEIGYREATEKLAKLILGKKVLLRQPIKLSYQRLLCRVFFQNRNLADFFPEYQKKRKKQSLDLFRLL